MTFHDYVTGKGGQSNSYVTGSGLNGMLEGSDAHSHNATRKAGRGQQCMGR